MDETRQTRSRDRLDFVTALPLLHVNALPQSLVSTCVTSSQGQCERVHWISLGMRLTSDITLGAGESDSREVEDAHG